MIIKNDTEVAAVVLAAGMSQRMGTPKMALPWKDSTVLGTVSNVLHDAGVEEIHVVTGSHLERVEGIINELPYPVAKHFNPNYSNGEMLDSIKVGLSELGAVNRAALIALGDQPQIELEVVENLLRRYYETPKNLVVPSYHKRRGHPWIIARGYWGEIIGMGAGQTMRDFFGQHAEDIDYLIVDTPSVLQDLDTPDDYRNAIRK